MPRIKYQHIDFKPESLQQIRRANKIIEDYAAQGFDLTLRQLYYQFVSRNLIRNTEREYKNLGTVIANGRLAGLIDWEAITDRTRRVRKQPSWGDPESIVSACAEQFRLPKWDRQPEYVEVWIEKDALVGVIEGVCEELDVPYLACRGYASASEVWRAGHSRIIPKLQADKQVTILYLGDHDPSGIDMTRDILERLRLFSDPADTPLQVEVVRLALNMDQVEEYGPPPNPTKMSDSRAGGYFEQFGGECWELDALEPTVIAELIREAVLARRDESLWDKAVKEETKHRRELGLVAKQWRAAVKGARSA